MSNESESTVLTPEDGYTETDKENPDEHPEPIPVKPDRIANELISYPHWVCWRFEWKPDRDEWSKIPINPETGGNARANDLTTATSFQKALEYHQREDTDGLGFILTGSPFVGVDYDGVFDPETGEWDAVGRDIIATLESYSEFSPGGRGGHTIMIGELPGSDRKGDPVEMYESGRYFTVTGQRIPETPDSIPSRDDGEDRLAEVHREYFPDDYDNGDNDQQNIADRAPSTSRWGKGAEFDDDELIEKAKDATNGAKFTWLWNGSTAGYDSHSEADMALCNLLGFWTGGGRAQMDRLFRQSGLMRPKWDQNCTAEGDTYGEHTIDEALDGRTEYYDPTAGTDADAGENAGDDTDDEGPLNPDVPKPDAFSVRNGGYGTMLPVDDDGEVRHVFEEWTNFELELNSIITTPAGETEMSITVFPRDEPSYTVEVEPTVLNEPRSFKNEICTGTTTTWDGSESDLTRLKQFVGSQDAPRKVGTRHMGYHRDGDQGVWITPNGAIGPDGWIEDSDLVLLEQRVTAERKWRLTPDEHTDYDPQNVVKMLKLLTQARDHERLLPLLGYFCAASVKPLVMDWEGQFNFASVSGGSGSGKTTTIETLWRLMGMNGEPLSADSTKITLLQTLSASHSIPMWFDEYKPSDMSDYKVKNFKNELRKSTRGGIGQRGTPDLSDREFRLHAPVIVSGEERIQGTAEERRGIFTSFRKSTTNPGTPTAEANAKLLGSSDDDLDEDGHVQVYDGYDFNEHALAWVQWITAQDPDRLETLWQAAYEYTKRRLSELGETGLRDLPQQGIQTIRFGCELYRMFYETMGGDDGTNVISDEEIDDAVEFVVTGSAGGGNTERSHLDVLLDVASRAARVGAIEEDDCYTFVRKGSESEELRINLNTTFDKVKKYAREHEVSEDLLNNKSDYDGRLRDDGDNIAWLTCRKQQSPPVGSAIGVDTQIAEQEIDGFSRWMWDETVDGSHADAWQRLDTDVNGRINITFEVTNTTDDTPHGIVEKGTIADEAKSMDYIIWPDDAGDIDGRSGFDEGECYAVKGARLDEYNGNPQIVFDSGVREVQEVQPGYKYIPSEDPGPNAQLDDRRATADGGEEVQLAQRVMQVVESHAPTGGEFIAGAVLMSETDVDYTRDDVLEAIDSLEAKGRITDFGNGYELSH